MKQYRSWLPASIFSSEQAAAPLARVVREWSAEWLASETWHVTSSWEPADITLGDDWSALRFVGPWSLLGNADSIIGLARAILGCGDQTANARDVKLMRRLAGDGLDDLISRIEQSGFAAAAAAGAADTSETGWVLTIGGRSGALRLLSPQSSLTAMLKGGFERTKLPRPLSARADSICDVDAKVSVLLGRARLSVDSLQSLERGDVVVLDRHSAASLDLVVADRPTDLSGKISELRGQLALEMQDCK
jgi:flagellar motor switch/type III secretory pathway protein FliN